MGGTRAAKAAGEGPALKALAQGRPALLVRRLDGDTETPVSAWLKLAQAGRGDFLLESVEGGRTRGRYSILGLDPDLAFRAHGVAAEVNPRWRAAREAFEPAGAPTLDALRALIDTVRADVAPDLPPAIPLLVGHFGYETAALAERLPVPDDRALDLPDLFFVRPGLVIVFDRLLDRMTLVAPVWPGAGQDGHEAVAAARARIARAEEGLAQPLPPAPALAELVDPAPRAMTDPARYRAMVEKARAYIAAGDIFQVVLAQRFEMAFPLPPFALYRALRRVNPSPFLYHLDLPGYAVTGSSPEILVRARDGDVTIRPIAGTRPRGETEAADQALAAALLADPKERAEHLMLLDLGRNDAGRVAQAGSVEVTEAFMIERYSHVMHIVSNVVGRLRAGVHPLDALLAGFPAGTVSGAPKIRAMEIIAELEGVRRGPYAGGIAYFAPDGGMDSCIVLRTAVVKDGVMHVTAGAGVVADSDPKAEQRECEAKAGALIAAAREALMAAGGEPGRASALS